MDSFDKRNLKELAGRYVKAKEVSKAEEERFLDCGIEEEKGEKRAIRKDFMEARGDRNILAVLIADIIIDNLEEITGEENVSK